MQVVTLTNASAAAFHVTVLVQPAAPAGGGAPGPRGVLPLPAWLEVSPVTFVLPGAGRGRAEASTRVQVRAQLPEGGGAQEPLALRFMLRPLYGASQQMGAGPGPAVTVRLGF